MPNLYEKVDGFLLENTSLIDKLYLFKVYLKLKKMVSVGKDTKDITILCKELDYLIREQKNDRSNVWEIYSYIARAEQKLPTDTLVDLKNDFVIYLDQLSKGLVVNELYLLNQKGKVAHADKYESDFNINFENVLRNREKITNKQFVIKSKK